MCWESLGIRHASSAPHVKLPRRGAHDRPEGDGCEHQVGSCCEGSSNLHRDLPMGRASPGRRNIRSGTTLDPLGFRQRTGPVSIGHPSAVRPPGDPPEVAVFEPVAVAFEVDDLGVVDEAVDHGGGDGGVTEDFAPAAEGLVAR